MFEEEMQAVMAQTQEAQAQDSPSKKELFDLLESNLRYQFYSYGGYFRLLWS